MKHLFFLVVLLFMAFTTQAQHWQWERQNTGGSTCAAPPYASTADPVVATDKFGGVYLSGGLISPTGFTVATTSVSFGSYSVVDTAWGIFIAKFDTFGNIRWLKNITGSGTYATAGEPNCLYADSSGNLYLTGYSGDSILKIGSYVMHKDPSFDQLGFFIAKFDSGGNFLWARQVDPEGQGYHLVYPSFITLDRSGNVIAAVQGGYSNQFDTISIPSPYLYTVCVAKYSPSGQVLWARGFEGFEELAVEALACDDYGNIIVGGYSYDSLLFGNDTLPIPNLTPGILNYYHSFIAKYDSSGHFIWAKSVIGDKYDLVTGLTTDREGNIYGVGSSTSTSISIDTATITNPYWLFFRLNPEGHINWYRTGYAVDTTTFERNFGPNNICQDGSDNLYLAGMAIGDFFITGTDTILYGDFGYTLVLKADTAGNIYWGLPADGIYTNSIAAGLKGQVYTASSFMYPGIATYGPDTLYTSKAPGAAVLARIDTAIYVKNYQNIVTVRSDVVLFPNPSFDIIKVVFPLSPTVKTYFITDVAGHQIRSGVIQEGATSFNLDISSLVPGCYILVVQSENGNTYRNKFVKY